MGSKSKDKKKNKTKPDAAAARDGGDDGAIVTDRRFAAVHSDPRFQKVPKRKSKVTIDSRFDRMFTDKNFASSSAPFDKRGKPKKEDSRASLRHYYQLEEEEEEKKRRREEVAMEEEDSDDDSEISEEEEEDDKKSETSGSEEEEEEEDEEEEDSGSTTEEEDLDIVYDDGEPEPQEEDVRMIERETRRLAVVNMDWRNVTAADLYVLFSSFLPKGGQIVSVAVYPSEFGLQRMKEEEVHGPVGIFDDENEENDDEDDEIDNEKLRAYEKTRLRYYYAVVEFDSSSTADYIYKACDGTEFERSSNVLDLRFIPDSMEFKHPPRDVATEAPANYEGLDFHTQALQLSDIRLTWDDDEPERMKTLKRQLNPDQLADLELKDFLASDESESDEDEDNNVTEDQSKKKNKKRDLYRALLQSGNGSDKEGVEDDHDMEVTFNSGLEDLSKRILEKKDTKSESVWEAYLRKRREKKKARKNKSKYSSEDESSDTDREIMEQPDDFFSEEPPVKRRKKGDKQNQDTEKEAEASRAELELLLADDKGAYTGLKGYNLKPKKSKGKKDKDVPDEDKIPTADFDDPRFSALFTSPLFALDPTDPQFKRSAAYARQIVEKQQKGDRKELVRKEAGKVSSNSNVPPDDPVTSKDVQAEPHILQSKKQKQELTSLVKSLKMKSKQVQVPSNGEGQRKGGESESRGMGGVAENNELSPLVQSLKRKTKVLRK